MTVSANFNGKQYIQPGSASQIIASALNNTQLGYSGIVAIVGSCTSGQPKVPTVFSSPGQLKGALGSGPAYDGARRAFSPSTQQVEGNFVRPQLVYVVRADQATQSALTLQDANSVDSLVMTSKDYGTQNNLINAMVKASTQYPTTPAINITLAYNGALEQYNNIGKDPVIKITYSGGAATAVVTVTSSGLTTTLGTGAGTDQNISAPFASFPTVQNLVDYINTFTNYQASTSLSSPSTYNGVDMDYMSNVDIINSGNGNYLYGVLFAAVNALNNGSSIVTAARAASPDGQLPPKVYATPVYFSGGSTTSPTNADYQACLTALQAYRINFVSLATSVTIANGLAAVFGPWLSSLQGVNECHGHVGTNILNTPSPAPTFDNLQAIVNAFNNPNVNFWSDAVLIPNDLGAPTQYDSWMSACMAAGFQGGTPPGTSFVNKSLDVLQAIHVPDIVGGTDMLDPAVNADAMILARFSFMKFNDATKSWNVVRALTTYTQDGNDYNTEPGIRSATNYAVYSIRQDIEQKFLGARTLFTEAGSTADSIMGELLAYAKLLEAANIIIKGTQLVNNQKVTLPAIVVDNVSISGDIVRLRYGIRPIGSINFIFHTINLNPVQQVATA
ncbi:Uncharacterised protein [uncultured archaeon]|nr:Uncharacterised protein [uncultured archaeon]